MNKRIDSLEASLKEDNAEIKSMIKNHLDRCDTRMGIVSGRIGKLEGFKNKALGATALFLVLLGLWQAAKVI